MKPEMITELNSELISWQIYLVDKFKGLQLSADSSVLVVAIGMFPS